jgi:hypothetical protein
MPNTRTTGHRYYNAHALPKQPRKGLDYSPCDHKHLAHSLKRSIDKPTVRQLVDVIKHSQYRIGHRGPIKKARVSGRPAKIQGTLEQRFHEQSDKWRQETEHLSSPAQIMMHPSYQAILGMAKGREQEMIRLMLHDLRENRTPWFWALSYLTQQNPIERSAAGKLDKMIKAWIDWGKTKGIL